MRVKSSANELLFSCLKLVAGISIGFGIHVGILALMGKDLWANEIIAAYIVNTVLAVVFYITTSLLIKKIGPSSVYIFFAAGVVKAGIYLLIFKPIYMVDDGEATKAEFLTYFVPFGLSLIFEVMLLIRQINDPNANSIDETSP